MSIGHSVRFYSTPFVFPINTNQLVCNLVCIFPSTGSGIPSTGSGIPSTGSGIPSTDYNARSSNHLRDCWGHLSDRNLGH